MFGSHTFVPTSWMCKKQTSAVSHSSKEAEIIPLGAGLRMDGMPALDRSVSLFSKQIKKPKMECEETRRVAPHQTRTLQTKPRFQFATTTLNWVMFTACRRSLLNSVRCSIFWRTKKQWQMIIRSPTMRHASRNPQSCSWLVAWQNFINLNPKIQIKYVDTKHQLADILTKGNFTRHG